MPWDDAIVETFLTLLAARPDTHIARRGGRTLAAEVSRRRATALAAGGVRSAAGRQAIDEMDRALRDARNIGNPGTTADLTAAAIFVVLLGGRTGGTGSRDAGGGSMQRRGEFRVSVTKDYLVFASAHFITFAGHRCEGLHGHNYRARVTIEGALNEESWFVFDFVELKRIMRGCATRSITWCCCRSRAPRSRSPRTGETVKVRVDGKPRYVFPRRDCALLPIPNTTVEMLARAADRSPAGRARDGGRARADGDRDGSRRELRAVGGLSRDARRDAIARPRHRAALSRPSCSAVATSAPSQPASASRARSSGPRTPPPATSVTCGHRRRARAPISSRSSPPPVPTRARSITITAPHAGVGRARRHDLRRFNRCERPAADDRLAVAQIEAERDAIAADRCADLRQRVVRRQRFEPDDDIGRAERERVACAVDGDVTPASSHSGAPSAATAATSVVLRPTPTIASRSAAYSSETPSRSRYTACERRRVAGIDAEPGHARTGS